jgi:hypothetical protein
VRKFEYDIYNLVYVDCSDLVVNVFLDICNLHISIETIKDKDIKKLIFHFIVTELIKRNKHLKHRPVFFIDKKILLEFTNKDYIKHFLYVFKHIKSLLPVPLLILNDQSMFTNRGDLKGYNEKINNHYMFNKKGTYKLRKYLEMEEFYELVDKLADIKNIKLLST